MIKGVNDDISGCPRISAIAYHMWTILVHLQLATNGEKKSFLRLLLFHPPWEGKGSPSFLLFFFSSFFFFSSLARPINNQPRPVPVSQEGL